MSRQDDLKRLIAENERRLQKLKVQEALTGIQTDPSVLIEIGSIEQEIEKLQNQLKIEQQDQENENLISEPVRVQQTAQVESSNDDPVNLDFDGLPVVKDVADAEEQRSDDFEKGSASERLGSTASSGVFRNRLDPDQAAKEAALDLSQEVTSAAPMSVDEDTQNLAQESVRGNDLPFDGNLPSTENTSDTPNFDQEKGSARAGSVETLAVEPQLINRLSPSSRQAVRVASAIGRQIGRSNFLTTEALLIALDQKTDGSTQAVLAAFGYPSEKFFNWINHNHNWSLSEEVLERATTDATNIDVEQISFSPTAEQLLHRAGALADERQTSTIRTRNLLLAMLDLGFADDTEPPMAFLWLQQMGLPVEAVRNILAQVPEEAQIVSSMFAYSASSAFADTAAQQDTLGFEMYAQALAEIIVKPETIPPVVIGVYGPWGSGKSTFMTLVKQHLEEWNQRQHPHHNKLGLWPAFKRFFKKDAPPLLKPGQAPGPQPRVVCVYFNAWAYTDADKLWAGLVEKISPYLDQQIPWWKKPFFWAGRNGWRFLGAIILGVSPILAGLVVIYLLSLWGQIQQWEWVVRIVTWVTALVGSFKMFSNQKPLTQAIGSLISSYDATETEGVMSRVQEEFNKTVKDYFLLSEEESETGKAKDDSGQGKLKKVRQNKLKVVVMIDELDRCPLEKMVDILEAIKIFLAEEIFIVLMAVDTRVIAEAIRLHYKDVKNPNLAREYLEKIIQIPVQVPEADHTQLTKFVNSLMAVAEEETPPDEEGTASVTEDPVTPAETGASSERGLLAVSEDLFNPLRLSDTAIEREAIIRFADTYLDSNPRRIKRLLNTYRYVKILATRQGERTDQEEWQEKMINWLGFTMRWPTFMARAMRLGRLPSDVAEDQKLLTQLNEDLPPRQQPPVEAFNFTLPNTQEIARFEELADNFIVESPPEVVAPLPDTHRSGPTEDEQQGTKSNDGVVDE